MHGHYPTMLSIDDHDRLQAMMCTMIGARTPLAGLLRRKLGSAVVMLPSDLAPDVVASGRLVRFRIDGSTPIERRLLWQPQRRGGTRNLSLHLPRGLALLGLSVGESISYVTNARQTELVEVDYVFPEDADDAPPLGPPGNLAGVLAAGPHAAFNGHRPFGLAANGAWIDDGLA